MAAPVGSVHFRAAASEVLGEATGGEGDRPVEGGAQGGDLGGRLWGDRSRGGSGDRTGEGDGGGATQGDRTQQSQTVHEQRPANEDADLWGRFCGMIEWCFLLLRKLQEYGSHSVHPGNQ